MNIEKINPVGARVLLEIYTSAQESTAGLVLSDNNASSTPVTGKVLRVGKDSIFKEGQTVFFRRYSVDELKFNTAEGEQKVFLLEDEEIIAVLED